MSFYDTLRCLYHDPGYLWEIHGVAIVGAGAIFVLMFVMWGW